MAIRTLDLSSVDDSIDTPAQFTYHHQLYAGPVTDAHVHFIAFEANEYPWLRGPAQLDHHPLLGKIDHLRQSYTVNDARVDSKFHKVATFVHVQANAADPFREAESVEALTGANAEIGAIVAYVDLSRADADAQLAKLATLPHVRGVRQVLDWYESRPELSAQKTNLIKDATWRANYALLAKHKFSFDFHGFSHQLSDAAELAREFPAIPLIVNHAGMCIDHTEESIAQWEASLKALAALPNTWIKISGLGQIDKQWTAESIRPFILTILDSFGTERCMFGSNFPIEKVVGTYQAFFTAFKQLTSHLTPEQQRKVFYENARRVYRIDA